MSERRTTHGALCPRCGSSRVLVNNTKTRVLECDPSGRVLLRKQGLRCATCGLCWWRDLRIEETVVDTTD